MSGLRERFLVARADRPRAAAPAPRGAERATTAPPTLGVLAAPALTACAGAAVALAAARVAATPVALVCVWSPARAVAPALRAPALPATRRLAGALTARGHEATAAGRLVVVHLDGDEAAAAAAAGRALAAAGPAAAVVAIGARSEPFDSVLAGQDAVLVWPPPDAPQSLGALAVAGLDALGRRAVVVPASLGPRGRALATAGLAGPPVLIAAVREALA